MAGATIEITNLGDLQEQIRSSGVRGDFHSHVRAWFRGHSRDTWEIVPGVYRGAFGKKSPEQRLLTEQHLHQDFKIQSASIISKGDTSAADLYFLQQHYGMPTRLLDWTTNPLAAMYFAVSQDDDHDGEFLMMDAYGLAEDQKVNPKYLLGIAVFDTPVFKDAIKVIDAWRPAEEFPEYIIPVRPRHFDSRMRLQHSCFTFHVPKRPCLTEKENGSLRRVKIPAKAKAGIRTELEVFGIDPFSIFGDLDRLTQRLKSAYEVDR